MAQEASKRFKALSNENRLAIFEYLRGRNPDCCGVDMTCNVGDVAEQFDLALSTISHHLKILNEAGLICCEQQGQRVCCYVNQQAVDELRNFFSFDDD
jgi:ArsR family transcriptional regulator, arsenate/arsenite/antimonite-responsive transcriptional repressor